MGKIIAAIVLGILIFGGVIYTAMYFNYNNQDVSIRKEAEAQRGKVEIVYDNMWKVIHQTNEVKNSYSSDFKETVKGIMEGRYAKGDGSLMKLVVEQNPTLSPQMYTRVMDAINIERQGFVTQQTRMLDIIRQHETLLSTIPSKFFITNKTHIQYTTISSTRTKEVMVSGIDDNVEL